MPPDRCVPAGRSAAAAAKPTLGDPGLLAQLDDDQRRLLHASVASPVAPRYAEGSALP